MTEDRNLLRQLLDKLAEIEPTLQPTESLHVQPQMPGQQGVHPVSVAGYDADQLDYHLKLLCQRGFIETGGPACDAAMYGVFFNRLTSAGHQARRS